MESDKDKVNENKQEESSVTVQEVGKGKIDYDKLVKQFGTELIDDALLEKFQKVTGKDLHPWMKRGIFFSHRSLNQFLDAYENGDPIFLYTGRGPTSDAMHIGHLIPFMFTKWLQDVFDCPLVIQIADEEKAAFKKKNFQEIYKMGFENAKEIISCGFNPAKTFIFSNRDYRLDVKSYEVFVSEMKMKTPMKELQNIFGFDGETTIATYDWAFYQSAAAFYQSYPHIFDGRPAYCLIPYAIDQDPYFRLARDIATKMNLIKPCSIMCKFIPPLTGMDQGKMSSSVGGDSTLFLTDDEKILREKIMKHCYSGGGGSGTLEDHKKFGGNTDVDIAYQYLRYFEENENTLKNIHDNFKKGDLSCGEIKEILAKKLYVIMEEVRKNRATVTSDILNNFYSLKPMELPKPKPKKLEEAEIKLYAALDEMKIEHRTKYHGVISTDEERDNLERTVEGSVCKVLFLKGKESYYLYIIDHKTSVNSKTLHKRLGVPKISFGQNDTLEKILQVPRICSNIFGIMNDSEKQISEIIIEEGIPKDKPVNFYAMRPDGTVTIAYNDLIKFIEHNKYPIKFIKEAKE